MMNNNIIQKMDNNFVENYEDVIKYHKKLNDILNKMGFDGFESYNDFCKKIRNNAINKLKKDNKENLDLDTNFFSLIMNDLLRNKIKEDENYVDKLKIYFNIDNIDDII